MNRSVLIAVLWSAAGCSASQHTAESVSTQRQDTSANDDTGFVKSADKPVETPPKKTEGDRDEPASESMPDPWHPYFDTPSLADALAAFNAGRNRQAALLFEAYVRQQKEGPRILPARFVSLLSLSLIHI